MIVNRKSKFWSLVEQAELVGEDVEASGDFASAEEFAHLLEEAGAEEISEKQKEWEDRMKKNKKRKTAKDEAEDGDEEDGDTFDLDDLDDSGEEEDTGDFNFASKYVSILWR